jgi:hypothetical protein
MTGHGEPSQAEELKLDSFEAEVDDPAQDLSHRVLTPRERDSGTKSVSHGGSAELTGKLCQHMMALIQWKVGADVAVTEHVVRALEEWLCRRGISIYTDLL